MVEVRRLQQLFVLAEELNFHRAAERLHLSQSALSRSIAKLEREVGAILVDRTTHRVGLTSAGAELVGRSAPLLAELDEVVEMTRRRSLLNRETVRLGFKAGAVGRVLTPTIRLFESLHPGTTIELRRLEWADCLDAVAEHRVDMAFFIRISPEDPTIRVVDILREHRVAVLPADHALATRAGLSIEDLSDLPFAISRSVPDEVARWWSVIPRPDGKPPRPGPTVDSIEELLQVVAAGHGTSIVSRSVAAFYGRPDVVFVPVHGIEPARVGLAWRVCDHRSTLGAIRDAALDAARTLNGRNASDTAESPQVLPARVVALRDSTRQ